MVQPREDRSTYRDIPLYYRHPTGRNKHSRRILCEPFGNPGQIFQVLILHLSGHHRGTYELRSRVDTVTLHREPDISLSSLDWTDKSFPPQPRRPEPCCQNPVNKKPPDP